MPTKPWVQSPEDIALDRANASRIRSTSREAARSRARQRAFYKRHKSHVGDALERRAAKAWKPPRLASWAVWQVTDALTGEAKYAAGSMAEPILGVRARRWQEGRTVTVVRVLTNLRRDAALTIVRGLARKSVVKMI